MFTCTVCDRSFTCGAAFVEHERSHADQLLSCDICAKAEQAKIVLKQTVTTPADAPASSIRIDNLSR